MNKITKLGILLSMLWLGCIGAFARTKGATEAIYYSEPYHIYTPYYGEYRVAKSTPVRHGSQQVTKPVKPKKERKKSNATKHMLLGIDVGNGFDMFTMSKSRQESYWTTDYSGRKVKRWRTVYYKERDYDYRMTFAFNLAYPCTKAFGLGVYGEGGFCTYKGEVTHAASAGLLALMGNYHDRRAAFMLGLGYANTGAVCEDAYETHGMDFRIGVLFNKGVYITTDLSTNFSSTYPNVSMTLNIGYNFGALFKVR